jgi:hypothetical protein
MKNKLVSIVMGIVIAAAASHAAYKFVVSPMLSQTPEESAPRIAKVGATGVKGVYNPSINAFDAQYAKGFRHFSVSLNLTNDGQLVCASRWGDVTAKLFKGTGKKALSIAEFAQSPTINGERPCSIDSLAAWMDTHPDASLVVSLAAPAASIVPTIVAKIPNATTRVAVLAANTKDANAARASGIKEIYWLVSSVQNWQKDESAIKYVEAIQPQAVIFPANNLGNRKDFIEKLTSSGIVVYANIVNDCDDLKRSISAGANGITTDTLSPEMCK